jgi:hypothetical protein
MASARRRRENAEMFIRLSVSRGGQAPPHHEEQQPAELQFIICTSVEAARPLPSELAGDAVDRQEVIIAEDAAKVTSVRSNLLMHYLTVRR